MKLFGVDLSARHASKPSRGADVIAWPDRILVHSVSKTTAGVGLAAEPWIQLPVDASSEQLGAAVREAIHQAKLNVPHPTRWAGMNKELFKAANVGSLPQFMRYARRCAVDLRGERLVITPSRNGGSSGKDRGFRDLPEHAVELPSSAAPGDIGEAVVKALSITESEMRPNSP